MTSADDRLAMLHRSVFGDPLAHGWGPSDLSAALHDPRYEVLLSENSYAIAMVTLDEAELVLIGVTPDMRGQGRARDLLDQLHETLVARGVARVFLEVAEDNTPALGLYLTAGYREIGKRPNYYARDGQTVDAILFECHLPARDELPI
ncbi:GNAT family N-acetyltransferase [Shimia ponticola]|uniref:GNAT family N-acetyltransferase n=1 Tax=Shimia ponticola TaxID=2582893 RepID=UPI0011BDE34B|nr:GNAT family N-acetyltransferase [Shimia ponticola]